jgi:hypothetical protein
MQTEVQKPRTLAARAVDAMRQALGGAEQPDVIEIHRRRLASLQAQRDEKQRGLDDVAAAAGDTDALLDELQALDSAIARQREVLAASERGMAAIRAQVDARDHAKRQQAADEALAAHERALIEAERLFVAFLDHWQDEVEPLWEAFRAATVNPEAADDLYAVHRPHRAFQLITAAMAQRLPRYQTGAAAPSRQLESLGDLLARKRSGLLQKGS